MKKILEPFKEDFLVIKGEIDDFFVEWKNTPFMEKVECVFLIIGGLGLCINILGFFSKCVKLFWIGGAGVLIYFWYFILLRHIISILYNRRQK